MEGNCKSKRRRDERNIRKDADEEKDVKDAASGCWG